MGYTCALLPRSGMGDLSPMGTAKYRAPRTPEGKGIGIPEGRGEEKRKSDSRSWREFGGRGEGGDFVRGEALGEEGRIGLKVVVRRVPLERTKGNGNRCRGSELGKSWEGVYRALTS